MAGPVAGRSERLEWRAAEWLLRLRDRLERGAGRTPARDIRVIALTTWDLVAEVERHVKEEYIS